MLGEREAAADTMAGALRKNPDDPWLHANQGYACLHANDPKKAAEHFREALRLDPEMDFARAGIIEALKARNIIYRVMLMYFLFMARLSSQAQWGIIIGLYILNRVLRSIADAKPEFSIYITPILIAYALFALMTWISYPLFNLLLRLDRFGRYALNSDQRKGANLLGATLAIAILSLIAFFATGIGSFLGAAFVFGLLALPASAIYQIEAGWPRYVMIVAAVGVFLLGSPLMLPFETPLDSALIRLLPMAIIGVQFLGIFLGKVQVRK
jgi:hypothetical protein